MTIELSIERFKRLPRRSDDEWQGGLVRMPAWIERGPDGRPYRPWAGFWVSSRTGFVHFKIEPETGVHDWRLALDALVEFATKSRLAGYRPARLQVADEDMGRRLLDALNDGELEFAVAPELAMVRRVLADFAEHMSGRPPIPGALEADGVTVDRMRAFADAAARFYEATPWRHLSGDDLIEVEAPVAEPGLRYAAVLGSGGQTFGLGFFESATDYDRVEMAPAPDAFAKRARWSLLYERLPDMPFGDADLWEQHNLPVAGDEAYPVALQFKLDRTPRRPDAGLLSYLEGLLRAIADTSESEMDRGRWTHSTQTYDGPVEYRLCIPELLKPLDAPPRRLSPERFDRRAMERVMSQIERFVAASQFKDADKANEALQRRFSGFMDAIPSTASTPLERAKELIYGAFESRGRRQLQLARAALELSPDCADAYVLLAERTPEAAAARDLYAQGVAAVARPPVDVRRRVLEALAEAGPAGL